MLDSVNRRIVIGCVVLGGIGAAGVFLLPEKTPPAGRGIENQAASVPARSTQSPFAALPAREGLSSQRGDLFGAPAAPPRRAAAASAQQSAARPPPAPPPMPYRIAGQLVRDGVPQIVLAREDRVLLVREGELLEGGYRVESISRSGVTLLYAELGTRETLPFAPSQPALAAVPDPAAMKIPAAEQRAAPARLRWEGPPQVQAGKEFNVALKITSSQLVRGSPVQLSYDAKLLEPVAVRAGDFFAGGSFTYRVNPGGTIFVGASGKSVAAADAEFLVVTFRPIRPGGVAELSIASMMLQGAAGGAVVHEPVAAFRTSITR